MARDRPFLVRIGVLLCRWLPPLPDDGIGAGPGNAQHPIQVVGEAGVVLLAELLGLDQ